MNQQAIHPQPPPQGNQPQSQPQNIPPPADQIENGRALFYRLCQNQVKEYSKFERLDDKKMLAQINSLSQWNNTGGPQNNVDRERSKLFVASLESIRQREAKRRSSEIPEIFIAFKNWLMKPSTSRPGSTATYGSDSSSSLAQGQSHKAFDASKINVEQEEKKPLKWE